jgi:hypothetical protein
MFMLQTADTSAHTLQQSRINQLSILGCREKAGDINIGFTRALSVYVCARPSVVALERPSSVLELMEH